MDELWRELIQKSMEKSGDNGLKILLEFLVSESYEDGTIQCPCHDCHHANTVLRRDAFDHVVCDGLLRRLEGNVRDLWVQNQGLKKALIFVILLLQKQFPDENDEIFNNVARMANGKVCDSIYF